MSSQESVSRPLTPYMLFCTQKRKKDSNISVKELGKLWNNLTKSKKQKYMDEYKAAKEKYDKFLEEIYGPEPLTYHRPNDKPIGFKPTRIRGVLGLNKEIKPMDKKLYPGLVKLLVTSLRNG